MPPSNFNLKQVGRLFNEALTVIRHETPHIDALEPQALQWLKDARYELMRDVEQAYYHLAQSRDDPLLQPPWVTDPTQSLFLMTGPLPSVLHPYHRPIGNNLHYLLKACGFSQCGQPFYLGRGDRISFNVYFPRLVTEAGAAPRKKPPTLLVEDEFAALERGAKSGKRSRSASESKKAASNHNQVTAFMASDLARLLNDAQEHRRLSEHSDSW